MDRPFHGVLSASVPESVVERCRAYAIRMQPGEAFSHATAAQLQGFPLPARVELDDRVHVAAVHPAGAPVAAGVRGHRLRIPPEMVEFRGLQVCSGPDTWCQLGARLTAEELTVIVDHCLRVVPGTPDDIRGAFRAALLLGRRAGGTRLRNALSWSRPGCASPGETRLRLLVASAGIPEPELNGPIVSGTRVLGRADFVWRSQRVLVEYEGDYHRTDRNQFRYDIDRYEQFRDAGWTVIRATADDLRDERRAAFVARLRRALAI